MSWATFASSTLEVAPCLTTSARRFSISSTIVGVCATTCSVRPVTLSAAAPSNRPAKLLSSSVSSNLVCAGHVWALKLCSLCAQLYLASPTSTLLHSWALPDLTKNLGCTRAQADVDTFPKAGYTYVCTLSTCKQSKSLCQIALALGATPSSAVCIMPQLTRIFK